MLHYLWSTWVKLTGETDGAAGTISERQYKNTQNLLILLDSVECSLEVFSDLVSLPLLLSLQVFLDPCIGSHVEGEQRRCKKLCGAALEDVISKCDSSRSWWPAGRKRISFISLSFGQTCRRIVSSFSGKLTNQDRKNFWNSSSFSSSICLIDFSPYFYLVESCCCFLL